MSSKSGVPLASIISEQQGVAIIVLNNPPVNSYSSAVAEALDQCITTCLEKDTIKAMILTGTGKTFVAGADIPSLLTLTQTGDVHAVKAFLERAHAIVNRIEHSPKPIVAAINGDCLGGGLELAMTCNVRVAVAAAKMGLPELKLGVLPGMGGTQRLPRLVGAAEALGMILASKTVNGTRANKIGLVDVLVEKPDELIPAALKTVQELLTGKRPKRIASEIKIKEPVDYVQAMLITQRSTIKKKAKNVVHPLLALDCIEAGILRGSKVGLQTEINNFAKCLQHPASQALLYFFLASKSTSKIKGLDLNALGKKDIKSAALVGSGTMSRGIAMAMMFNGMKVLIKDISKEALDACLASITKDVNKTAKMRKMTPEVVKSLMSNLTLQLDYTNFDKVDLVIEAVTENIPLKQRIFVELEKACSPTAIIATNTSTINIEEICANCQDSTKSRVIGLHFFSPAHIMPLLEIVKMKYTSPETIATSMHLAKKIKKTPVVVGNCIGFAANRIFFPYGMAGQLLVTGGLSPWTIDAALMSYGMPMGIFRMNDSVGVDIGTHIGPIFEKAYNTRTFSTELSNLMVKAGKLGEKTGVGFYNYDSPRKPAPNVEEIAPILTQVRAKAKELGIPNTEKLSAHDIVEICLYPVINESTRVLQEGFANSPTDLDVISVMGYGFPAYRGGVMNYAKTIGFNKIAERLQHWAEFFPKQAEFFKPSPALLHLAKKF